MSYCKNCSEILLQNSMIDLRQTNIVATLFSKPFCNFLTCHQSQCSWFITLFKWFICNQWQLACELANRSTPPKLTIFGEYTHSPKWIFRNFAKLLVNIISPKMIVLRSFHCIRYSRNRSMWSLKEMSFGFLDQFFQATNNSSNYIKG